MLLEFYGQECSHCIAMQPLVERLEKEEGIKIETFETWHNKENEAKMAEYDKGGDGNATCGGVPFFINTKSGKSICGETSFEELKSWAKEQ